MECLPRTLWVGIDFKGKEDIAFTFLSFRFAPEILVIIPLYFIYQNLHLIDSTVGLVWVYQLISLPLLDLDLARIL